MNKQTNTETRRTEKYDPTAGISVPWASGLSVPSAAKLISSSLLMMIMQLRVQRIMHLIKIYFTLKLRVQSWIDNTNNLLTVTKMTTTVNCSSFPEIWGIYGSSRSNDIMNADNAGLYKLGDYHPYRSVVTVVTCQLSASIFLISVYVTTFIRKKHYNQWKTLLISPTCTIVFNE